MQDGAFFLGEVYSFVRICWNPTKIWSRPWFLFEVVYAERGWWIHELFFASLWHPQVHSSVLRQPNIRRRKKNRVSGSQVLGMCFIVFTRVYITSIVAMYSPMLNLFIRFIWYLTMNHMTLQSPRQRFIFVLIHLIYIFAHSFPSYALTCKYGCLIGFFPAVLLDWCFTLSTGLLICLVNLGLRMIAK